MNAVNAIDQLKAAKRVQQTLRKDPNNVKALLELAGMLGRLKEPDLVRKRQVLNRALSVDPANKTAREMLLEMDRVEMGADRSQTMLLTVPTTPASASFLPTQLAKPLVFRYSIIHQVLVYPLLAIAGSFSLMAFPDWKASLVFGVFFLLLFIPVWFVSAVVEINSSGIKLRRLFGIYEREMERKEIESVKPNLMGVGIKLSTAEGTSLRISSQIHGYPAIMEILWKMRPDLFNMSGTYSVDEIGSSGTKIFQKGFLAKYGLFFLLVPATPLALGGILVPPFLPGILITALLVYLWTSALSAAHFVKVEEDRLSIKSFRKNQVLTAQQISNINMVTIRNHRGVAKSMMQIGRKEGGAILLSGFPEGNEIMCGFLKNWWSAHQH